jgi:hypothetical protein
VVGLIEIFLCLRKKKIRELIFTLNYVFLFTLWIVWHAIGHTAFFPMAFVYPLQLPAFLMLCTWVKVSSISRKDFLDFCLTLVILWLALYMAYELPVMDIYHFVGFFVVISLLYIRFLHEKYSRIPYFLFIALSFSLMSFEPRNFRADCRIRSGSMSFYEEVVSFVQKHESDPDKILFYFENDLKKIPLSPSCRLGHMSYRMVSGNMAYIGGRLMHPYPVLKSPEIIDFSDFKPDSLLAIISHDAKDFSQRVLSRGKELGFYFVPVGSGSSMISNSEFGYEVFRVRLKRDLYIYPETKGPNAEQKIAIMMKLTSRKQVN